ncbi:MAG: hypothetical protein ACK5QQ_13985 [Cyanobacteriota bacterium]
MQTPANGSPRRTALRPDASALRPWPLLVPLALFGSAAVAADLPLASLEPALALPACRQALKFSPDAPAAQLLQRDPGLAARIAAIPACQPALGGLQRLERLERELQQSRLQIAAQQAQLAAEAARQETLAAELAQLRGQLGGSVVAASKPAPSALPAPGPAPGSAPGAASPATIASSPASTPAPPSGAPPNGAPPNGASSSAAAAAASPESQSGSTPAQQSGLSYNNGKGFTLQSNGAKLRLWAEAKLLGFSSSRYTFNSGQPLIVSPKNPDSSYDLSAQQSMVYGAFQGPQWHGWTPGAFAIFWLQDNILAEGYQFTPVVYYGEISNGTWRFAAGQGFDVFAPRDPDTLPNGKLAASGNPGAYRPQFRVENHFKAGEGFAGALQLAASSPVTTALPDQVDLSNLQSQEIVEDNGWPNVEGRLSLGFGATKERAGARQLRPLELGFSGVVGKLRVLDNIRALTPLTLTSDRSVISVWGAAFDGQLALGRRLGISGELYTGQGLGEYMSGILQTYNRSSNQAVPTSGGWAQLYVYLSDNLRLNLGYGIDHAQDGGAFSLLRNATAFTNLVWDVNPWLQLGLEGNYKLTTYDTFGDKNAWIVITQVMFRL